MLIGSLNDGMSLQNAFNQFYDGKGNPVNVTFTGTETLNDGGRNSLQEALRKILDSYKDIEIIEAIPTSGELKYTISDDSEDNETKVFLLSNVGVSVKYKLGSAEVKEVKFTISLNITIDMNESQVKNIVTYDLNGKICSLEATLEGRKFTSESLNGQSINVELLNSF